jgi:F-type H+-transporting ATPase subunit b
MTSLVVLGLFTLLFLMLRKLVFAPFLEDVDARDERTGKMRESAQSLRERAEALSEQYATQRDEALNAAQDARRELRLEGLNQKEAQMGEAQEGAQASYEERSKALHDSFDKARKEALSQAEDIAKSIASQILGRAVMWVIAAIGTSTLWINDAFAGATEGSDHGTYLWNLANQGATILLLVGGIIYFAGSGIKSSLKTRADELAAEIKAAQSAHEEAKQLLDEYEAKIAQLDEERSELLSKYRSQGEEERARLIEEGQHEAERIARDAERNLNNELTMMRRKIERELVERSLERAEELITKKINITDHNRLTQNYLSELD